MAKLVIRDLVESKELDRAAMKTIYGGAYKGANSGGGGYMSPFVEVPTNRPSMFAPYPTVEDGTKSTFGNKKQGSPSFSFLDDYGRSVDPISGEPKGFIGAPTQHNYG